MIICAGDRVSEKDYHVIREGVRTICDLITQLDFLFRIDDNLLFPTDCDDFGGAVWITRVIDQPATVKEGKEKMSTPRNL
jgi:hypothetical protein